MAGRLCVRHLEESELQQVHDLTKLEGWFFELQDFLCIYAATKQPFLGAFDGAELISE